VAVQTNAKLPDFTSCQDRGPSFPWQPPSPPGDSRVSKGDKQTPIPKLRAEHLVRPAGVLSLAWGP